MRASEIRELLKLLDQPDIISFAGGIPDPALFPTATIADAYARVLAEGGAAHPLQYSVSEGYQPLRRWIVDYMAGRGVAAEVDNIVITSGSQQALDLIGKLLISPGNAVLVTAPTYLGALQAFNAYEPRYATFDPQAEDCVTATRRVTTASADARAALAYVVADAANPTGETLDEAARRRILAVAADLDIPVIEDAAYTDLRFTAARQPALLALDLERAGHIDASRVIYCGTFSKTISPGLRVGWICAGRHFIHKVVLAKQASDLHTATINQRVIHETAVSCFARQVAAACTTYGARRDAMLAALTRYMPAGVSWSKPDGGMFVFLRLPAGADGAALLAASLAGERVAFVPGGAFFADGSGRNTIRLSYATQAEPMIEEGIRRLASVIAVGTEAAA